MHPRTHQLQVVAGSSVGWYLIAAAAAFDSNEPLCCAQSAAVSGRVQTDGGQPVVGSLVVPLDADSGRPLLATEGRLVAGVNELADAVQSPVAQPDSPRLVYSYSDQEGRFTFQLPSGKYRFMALRTPESDAPPTPLGLHGALVQLDGATEPIELANADTADVCMRTLGECELEIETGASNDDAYLFVSREATAADPVLGFAGWDSKFLGSLLCAVRMEEGRCRIRGLPPGPVHCAVFANDNNPGFGAVTVPLKAGDVAQTRIPLVASWSDGHKEPPEHLQKLVRQLEEDASLAREFHARLEQVFGEDRAKPDDPFELFHQLQMHLNDPVALPDGSQMQFKDVAAAVGYYRLRHPR